MKISNKTFVLTFILLVTGYLDGIACSCEGQTTVAQSVKYSDVVFSGIVISKTETTNHESLGIQFTGDTSELYFNGRKFPVAVIKIVLLKKLKGQLLGDTVTILTAAGGSSCGSHFVVGQKYIVYAAITGGYTIGDSLKGRTSDNKTFWTNQCTRTKIWKKEEEEEIIKALM
jgi:hypothetical protein